MWLNPSKASGRCGGVSFPGWQDSRTVTYCNWEITLCRGRMPWGGWREASRLNPDLPFTLPFGWFKFASTHHNTTVIVNIAPSRAPWVFLSQLSKLKMVVLSHFSRVRLCATPETAAHQAPPSLGFSRQEHRSGLPFPSPMRESEKWKWSRSVVPDS